MHVSTDNDPPTQAPIGSGLGVHTTAAEALAGLGPTGLTGRTVVVTGGYSGIGLATTQALHDAGARVLVPARRPDVAREALAGLDRVEVGELDLADPASVTAYAAGLVDAGEPLDAVILNAGVMACPETRTPQGWEYQLAANHLGHFALVAGLWPCLDGRPDGARVVSVSSMGHHFSPMRWHDLHFEAEPYDKWLAYGQSKTANVLFAVHLDRLGRGLPGRGVRAFALHPGAIITPLGRHLTRSDVEELLGQGSGGRDGAAMNPEWKQPEAGAATSVWAAFSPQLDGLGGLWLEDCEVGPVAGDGVGLTGVKPWAIDPAEAARLWAFSVEATGLDL